MGSGLKKFRCTNCGKTFEISSSSEDPIRCPYCGMSGVLVRVSEDKKATQPATPRVPTPPRVPTRTQPTNIPVSPTMKRFMCYNCRNIIEIPYGVPKPVRCPHCGAPHYMIHRIDPGGRGWGGRGFGRGRGLGYGRGRFGTY